MSKVNEPEEIRYQAFNRREDGYTNNNNNNNNNPETRGRERPQPTQQRPLRRRPATDPRQRIFNSNRRQVSYQLRHAQINKSLILSNFLTNSTF